MTIGGTDVVEHGAEPRPPHPLPPWLPRVGLLLGVLLALAAVSRTGLLSADRPGPGPAGPRPHPEVVVRVGDRLLLATAGGPTPGARLDAGLATGAVLGVRTVRAEAAGAGAGPVVGVRDGILVRAEPGRAGWHRLGAADEVVAASATLGRVLVQRSGRLREVSVRDGSVTDPDPYPGFDPDRWTARGVLSTADAPTLLLSAREPAGGQRLALAWPAGLLRTMARPAVLPLGTYGTLLGIADDWAITLESGCPGPACSLRVVSVTPQGVRSVPVGPPPGWTFVPGPAAGDLHEALVPVRRLSGDRPAGPAALARLVPGGDNALLVRGTTGVVLRAGLADGPHGTVVLLTDPGPGRMLRVLVWDAEAPAAATPARGAPTVPRSAHLVCVCG